MISAVTFGPNSVQGAIMSSDNSPRIRALRMLLMTDATVLVLIASFLGIAFAGCMLKGYN